MSERLSDKVIRALSWTAQHNSSLMEKPEVILWPDPERVWEEVIILLQEKLPGLLNYGKFQPERKTGPAIWIKCMVARLLPEADWDAESTPIIYLPGVSKADLRKVETAVFDLQPLLEYQYTGNLFLQENGKEWTVTAFVENSNQGFGIKVQKDTATKVALKKALPTIFNQPDPFQNKTLIDAPFLNTLVFPEINESILQWINQGDDFLISMDSSKQVVFKELCKAQFDFEPNFKNIKEIALKLGSQMGNWKTVWQLYANNPRKYPNVEERLRQAKPEDLGTGMFALPTDSWPQCNDVEEEKLYESLTAVSKKDIRTAESEIHKLDQIHRRRKSWIWAELDKTPLAFALGYLSKLVEKSQASFGGFSLEELQNYYVNEGFEVDQLMRGALKAVKSSRDKDAVTSVINLFYKPWLEAITSRFQKLIQENSAIFTDQPVGEETEDFVLFVDAFRFELAKEFVSILAQKSSGIKVSLEPTWSAIPSLTPTAKPKVSPIASVISVNSECKDFRPQLKNTKDLSTAAFRDILKTKGFEYVAKVSDIQAGQRYWMEIGDIDTKGHQEQSGLVKRVEELFELVQETVEGIFEKGYRRIKIVTDHGWLLLPGGLPKTQLNADLTETRWGRCALMKEGAFTPLLHLPWRWNPSVYIAYAPGISFFKVNEEYAHGGISIHECLIPEIILENLSQPKKLALITKVKWTNLKCNVETENAPDGYWIDVRTKATDENSSIVISKNQSISENKGRVMVSEDAEGNAATVLLLDLQGIIIDKILTTVGG
ncbi:BREX-1 system phosphatase PglZ type B [Mariniradius saccharolyticus]|nr:BREX-1 system phosphatase PglZ type B [Mariniradius saccharolyticus]